MSQLSAKARIGTLTPNEQTELDTFERLGCLLDIVHSKARQALKKGSARSKAPRFAKKASRRSESHG